MPKSDKQWKFGDGFVFQAQAHVSAYMPMCDVPTEIFLVGCHSDAAFKTVRVERISR